MPIIRNPFRKQDETVWLSADGTNAKLANGKTQPVDIKQPAEYKLSGGFTFATEFAIGSSDVDSILDRNQRLWCLSSPFTHRA